MILVKHWKKRLEYFFEITMSLFCTGNYYDYIVIPIATIAVISITPPIFIYFRAYNKGTFKTTRLFFYSAALLFILIYFTLILATIASLLHCNHTGFSIIYRSVMPQLFIFQNIILIGWFFWKLEYIFRGSLFALSKCIKTSFAVIYVLFCIFFITSGILWPLRVSTIMFPIAGALTLLLTIFLVSSFI